MKKQLHLPSQEGFDKFRKILESNDFLFEDEKKFLDDFLKIPIKERVRKLNAIYRTRISLVVLEEIASFISSELNFNDRLESADYSVVHEIMCGHNKKREDETPVEYFSFATKYCYHCHPDKYPIYDSVNMNVMKIYYGYEFKRRDSSNNYEEYVECFNAFCGFLGYSKLERRDGFYIDKYIQALGGINRKYLF